MYKERVDPNPYVRYMYIENVAVVPIKKVTCFSAFVAIAPAAIRAIYYNWPFSRKSIRSISFSSATGVKKWFS